LTAATVFIVIGKVLWFQSSEMLPNATIGKIIENPQEIL
jgi:hypothetical protein